MAAEAVGETLVDLGEGDKIAAYRLPMANGREIVAMTSASSAFRSKGRPGDRAMIDEAAFVDDLGEVLKAALTFRIWGGSVHVLSTHNGEGSEFNELAREVRHGERPGSLHTIPFSNAIQEGLYQRICREHGIEWTPRGRAHAGGDLRTVTERLWGRA